MARLRQGLLDVERISQQNRGLILLRVAAFMAVAAVVLLTHQGPVPAALVQVRADVSSALTGAGHAFDTNAARLESVAAANLQRAQEERSVKKILSDAQSELNAYAVNLEGMTDAEENRAMQAKLVQFPRNAANLHAILDESLSEADAIAVKMAQKLPVGVATVAQPHVTSWPAQQDIRRAFPSKGWTPGVADASSRSVNKVMDKLRKVKSFVHHSAVSTEAAATQMLVQPGALVGALPVKDGELYSDGKLFDTGDVEAGESEAEKWDDMHLRQDYKAHDNIDESSGGMNCTEGCNATTSELTPRKIVRACNSTCQETIIHSTIGLAFKVAARCVSECASSKYILDKWGSPLPAWKSVDQLKEQDEECKGDEKYLQCKLEELDPVCDKIAMTMPAYCPMHRQDSICVECVQMEEFEIAKRKKAEEAEGKAGGGCWFC